MKCPTCQKVLEDPRSPLRPFCSQRCKLVDLARWLDGDYAIPGEELPEEGDEALGETPEADASRRRLH